MIISFLFEYLKWETETNKTIWAIFHMKTTNRPPPSFWENEKRRKWTIEWCGSANRLGWKRKKKGVHLDFRSWTAVEKGFVANKTWCVEAIEFSIKSIRWYIFSICRIFSWNFFEHCLPYKKNQSFFVRVEWKVISS